MILPSARCFNIFADKLIEAAALRADSEQVFELCSLRKIVGL
jgi:hypothetical protein